MVDAADVQARIAAVEAATGVTIPDVESKSDSGGRISEAVATPPAPAPVLSDDPFDRPENSTFDRPYVERLRNEAAEARTKVKTYEDLDKLTPEKRDAWLTLARTMETDPLKAYQWLDDLVKESGVRAATSTEGSQPLVAAGDKPLTQADLERVLGERDAARLNEQLIGEVYGELRDVGLDAESPDPATAALSIAVMKVAADHTAGDIKAAYDLVVTAPRQKAIDDYVAEKANQGRTPRPVTGAPPSGERKRPEGMSPLEWAKKNALERIGATQA